MEGVEETGWRGQDRGGEVESEGERARLSGGEG